MWACDLFGYGARKLTSLGVLDIQDPNHDDFELWSPSEGREESCLFGRQTLYHRRIRDKNCYVGEIVEQPKSIVRNCTCTPSDFEWLVYTEAHFVKSSLTDHQRVQLLS
jgi:hypothetical protein